MKKYSYTIHATCPTCGLVRELKGSGSKDIVRTCRHCKTKRPKTLGLRTQGVNGYMLVQTSGGFVYEHRHIWEQSNGPVPSGYVIHHKDGNKTNNIISNLELLSKRKHDSISSIARWDDIKNNKTSMHFIPNKVNIDLKDVIASLSSTMSIRATASEFNVTKAVIIRILKENNVRYLFNRSTHKTTLL